LKQNIAMTEIQCLPPLDDTSISKPVSPTPSPSHLHTTKTLCSWLPLYLKKTDKTISHLNRILSTPSGTDSLLTTIQYSTLATSTLLSTLSLRRLHSQVLNLLSFARALPANTTILITPYAIQTPTLLRLSQSLKALSALISDFRIFVRLWGLLGIYKWGKGLAENPPKDRVLEMIAWAEVMVNVAYQVLENGAYLSSKCVLGWDARKQARAWAWSSRFWMAHVGLELTRLGYLWSERRRAGQKGKDKEMVGDKEVELGAWRRDLVSNAAYAPLTVHWSLEEGLVGDLWVGFLGTVAGGVGLAQLWKNTA
jgi:hypothetical protein